MALRVQDKWPGQKGNIFCLREDNRKMDPPIEEIERVPVISLKRIGKRLVVVLDRPINKRCDFLFLKKKYKTKDGEYEQIFWRTQQALKERKPRVKLITYHSENLNILIDTNEKYPWKFSNSNTEKTRLPVGDYALLKDNEILAVVERKTFDNLISEFRKMSVFHQQLAELSAYKYSALVIEANYSDFLKADKLKFYTPSFAVKAIAELFAFHPNLPIVFAGNRKLANEWTYRFFEAVDSHENDTPHEKISEIIQEYGTTPVIKGGIYYEIKKKIMDDLPEEFTFEMISELFPDIPIDFIKKVIDDLKKEKLITKKNRRKNVWKKM
ncbi:ERCC4 domain-containing protein [Deferribacter autotrophicus]|uniref:ERCC4 domain-containing protein n=1 Tax=Deferribacter autotrophicus TaxID=500465 RepID=UPI001CAA85AE|nr:ERCC4 domain-containing protein [Deferribacter autotrophicus]